MKFLLDTHLLVWLASESPQLSPRAQRIIDDASNELVFSAISIWEVATKFARGKSDFETEPLLLYQGLRDNGFVELSFDARHAMEAARLPKLHKDPFDRALAGQARAEGLTLLTSDKKLAAYGDPVRLI